MYRIYYVTIDFPDGSSVQVSYVGEDVNKVLDKAVKEYPNYQSIGASLNPDEDWNRIIDRMED